MGRKMEQNQKALYLFCFARSEFVRELNGTGVDGHHPLLLIRGTADLGAVVSEELLEDYCGQGAELRMQDLGWIGPRALRHESVVEEVMRHSPVLPARFGTLFSSREGLTEFMDKHHDAISEFLTQISDQDEWSVKGVLDRKLATQALISARAIAQHQQLAALPPGRRYFEERQGRASAEKDLGRWLHETCRRGASDLMKQTSDFCERPLVLHEPTESGVEFVFNWAFLLSRSAVPAFRAQIDELNANHEPEGLVFKLSGPWPPYNFVPPLAMAEAA